MPTLSNANIESLALRGVGVSQSGMGTHISLNSNGLMWVLNFLDSSKNVDVAMTLSLLKSVAEFRPKASSLRELRFTAVRLPVYDDAEYFQFVFYLNGSPPKAMLVVPPEVSAITNKVSIPMSEGGAFRIRSDQIIDIEFSAEEIQQLKKSELVRVAAPA